MVEAVLDASVVAKWFKPANEADVEAAQAIRSRFHAGALQVAVPPLLFIELINAAARRWRWMPDELRGLTELLDRLDFVVVQPPLARVAHWASQGLTAYDACYVALAEERRTYVVTTDDRMLAVGGTLARALPDFS